MNICSCNSTIDDPCVCEFPPQDEINSVMYPHITVNLSTTSHPMAIIGLCMIAARRAGLSENIVNEFKSKAMAGDLNHVLSVCSDYFTLR